jgi:hypothetical protein
MHTVNYEIFGSIFGCLEAAEQGLGRRFEMEGGDEKATKDLFRIHLAPALAKMLPRNREATYWTFRYYLTTRSAPITAIRNNAVELSLDMPLDEWDFIRWVWEVIWPGEDFRVDNPIDFREQPDIAEAGMIFARPRSCADVEDEKSKELRRRADASRAKFLSESPISPAGSSCITSGPITNPLPREDSSADKSTQPRID